MPIIRGAMHHGTIATSKPQQSELACKDADKWKQATQDGAPAGCSCWWWWYGARWFVAGGSRGVVEQWSEVSTSTFLGFRGRANAF